MKAIKRLLSILAVAFYGLFGCGYTPRYYYTRQSAIGQTNYVIYVRVDKEFSDMDRLAIDKAVFQWNYVLNGHYKLEVVDWDYDATDIKTEKVYPIDAYYIVKLTTEQYQPFIKYLKKEDQTKFVLGFAGVGGTVTYLIRDRLQQEDVYYVLMHELAHIFGSNHDGFRLMNPSYNKTDFQCVDWKTAEQVAKFLGLRINDLNWCFYISDFDEAEAILLDKDH